MRRLLLTIGLFLMWGLPAQAAIFFDSDFENCSTASTANWTCTSTSANGLPSAVWTVFNNISHVLVSTIQARTGTQSVRLIYDNVNGSSQQPLVTVQFTPQTHFFARVASYQVPGFARGSNGVTKRFLFKGLPNQYPRFSVWNYYGNYEISIEGVYKNAAGALGCTDPPHPGSQPVREGVWDDLELEVQLNTPGAANGYANLWVNGILSVQVLNREFIGPNVSNTNGCGLVNSSQNTINQLHLFLQSGNGELFYDRVAVGTQRIGTVTGGAPVTDTTPPSPPTNVTVQ